MINKIEVNLLPAEYRVHVVKIKFHKEIVIPAVIASIVLLVIFGWTALLNTQIADYNHKIKKVEADIAKNQHILDEINSLKKQKEGVQTKIRSLERIDVNREKWIRLMEVFAHQLPQGSWIDSLCESKGSNGKSDTVFVGGKTYSFSEVAQYMMRLKRSEFVSEVDLQNIEQLANDSKIYRFSISCYLNPDAKLGAISTEAEADPSPGAEGKTQ